MSTDVEWEKWGVQDPYYGVQTDPKFRSDVMTAEAKEEFFRSGRLYVLRLWKVCRKYFDPNFAPQRVLDFGCGVGRLVLPFATSAREVVGVDISDAMLAEAHRNCTEQNITNATLVKSDDALSAVEGTFDLVHTVIVLQHIESERGTRIVEQLLARLAPRGIGIIQVTYGKTRDAATLGVAPPVEPPPSPPIVIAPTEAPRGLRKLFGRRPASTAPEIAPAPQAPDANVAETSIVAAPPRDPEMQMYPYNLNKLFFLFQSAGVTSLHVEFTDHGGEFGAFLYFRKGAVHFV
jgi:SAM-dependent methyltransferase